ncbi:TLC domain-containing protein 4-like [Hibiscus syriacus]|uniref:TLC domain-containing protein 4-like n=1 Tax=Hibiscus syriacus TaxID=106335 RepID=UPI0019213FB7|nr:TLC domain-containing protein 4-like [Hibiscus syriacus]
MEIQSYQNQAELLLKEYLLANSLIPYTSVICGICACKMVYDLTQLFSSVYFKSYLMLSKAQRNEWNNRSISTVHAIFITIMSLYFVFWSNLFSDRRYVGLIMFRSSALSTFSLGVSVGYFLADIGMIIWFYPSLGRMEYVIHHFLSIAAVAYSVLTGEGQLYTFMVLISETTTPGINLRWYLDTAGMKRSRAYLINGVVIFVTWLVARVLLFMHLFYHVYLHYDQVKQLHSYGLLLILVVPFVLSIMNLMWFGKIIRGLRKTLAKRQ